MTAIRNELGTSLFALAVLGLSVLTPLAQAGASTVAITAHIAANSVSLNQTALVTGTVTPETASSRVVVQRGVHGHWSDRQAGTVATNGTFKIGIRPSQAGIYALRVRTNGGSVDSPTFYLRVNSPPCTEAVMPSLGETVDDVSCADGWAAVEIESPAGGGSANSYLARWNGTKWVVDDSGCQRDLPYPQSPPGIPHQVYLLACDSD